MFSINQHHPSINSTSSLPVHPKTPAHLREWTNVTRAQADDIMMALNYSHKPPVSLADMQCVRDMTGDRTIFDIEIEERSGGKAIKIKYPVSQYAYASAYCLYLAGDQTHYQALSDCCRQLLNGGQPDTARALAALKTVTGTFPPSLQPAPASKCMNLLLRNLPASNPAAVVDTVLFSPPASLLKSIPEEAPEPVPAARPNRRQRRQASKR